MTYPYTATIEGHLRKINGMDADDYILDNDEKLWIKPLKEGETFRALTLKTVSKLTFTGGQWVLDSENVKSRHVGATIKSHESSGEARTEAETTFHLLEVLKEVSDEDRTKIKGVAWFGERYAEVDGETAEMCAVTNGDLDALAGIGSHKKRRPLPPAKGFWPVLLTDYQVQSVGKPHKTKPRRSKPIAESEEFVSGKQNGIIAIGKRFRHTPGFHQVWLDGECFKLESRKKARACLRYLVGKKAFDEKTARHLETEIDPYVRKESGACLTADIRIHHYFNTTNARLKKLRELVKPVGRNGRYYLKLT